MKSRLATAIHTRIACAQRARRRRREPHGLILAYHRIADLPGNRMWDARMVVAETLQALQKHPGYTKPLGKNQGRGRAVGYWFNGGGESSAMEPRFQPTDEVFIDPSTRVPMRVYADPRTGEPVPVGVPGEILVGGAGPARGYLGRPALTAERFVPAPGGGRLYRSGDLARFRADGELDYLGRIDHQVKIRGFRVELGEIEAALAAHRQVAAAVVVPAGDGGRVERLAAWVVHTETGAPEVSELREHLARRLPSYMVPSLFFAVGELPSTPSGKVDRRALARRSVDASGAERTRAPHVPPATPTAKKLAAIWRDLLGVERVGMDDDFFALGGHSLIATQVLHRVEEELGVQVPLRRLFEVPTLAQLEAAVTEAQVLATGEDELLAMLAQLEEA